jgi:predicted CxxxxCH...CXXCH cytochrome family protein
MRFATLNGLTLLGLALSCLPIPGAEPTPQQVFEQRIIPIFQSPNPSSCVQCHLAGVDLKNYILPDADKTFRSLREQGLINLEDPEKSKILQLISMGAKETRAALIQQKVRQAEYEAFSVWIKACAADARLRAAAKLPESEQARPARPLEVIRHARQDRLLESFENNVWAWRFRCMNCHSEGTPQNDKYVKEYGKRVAWTKTAGAAATMEYLLASKLIDPARPQQSLLLRKPLGERHEGGKKFLVGDQAYQGFRAWIEDVAAIRSDRYAKASDLPNESGPERFGSDLWLKLVDCPPEWGGKLLQVNVHAWDAQRQDWEAQPLATSDREVAAKARLWQHNLTWLASRGSERAQQWQLGKPAPPAGRYLVKILVDRDGKLAKDWKTKLGAADYVGQVEFQARWREGYGAMTTVSASKVTK